MKPKEGKMYTQEKLLKFLKPCKICGCEYQEFEEMGESGLRKRLTCLGCSRTTIWAFQSIACIDDWNEE